MKQVLQHARTGEIEVLDVPAPRLLPGCVLVRIAASLLSAGTERASAEFAKKNLVQKAQARPDLVREVIAKVQRDGLLSAVSAVRSRLDQPTALGYSSAGTVIGVGEGITDLNVGDRVACAGAGYAVHAEFACIPRLLVAQIPAPQVSFAEAAFTTVGSVALHGVRIAEVRLGDLVAVIGLGLVGQLTVQVLKAAGCRVLGLDIVAERAQFAHRLGADAVSTSESGFRDLCLHHTRGHGVDAVLIAAETASSGPVNLAGELARDRGIVVAVGAVGMDIERRLYYEKELDFRVARSYGPGRYDAAYEQKGRDYPIGYVRWTETRNMEHFLQLLAEGKLDLKSIITHRFPIERALAAYELITGKTREPWLGVVIEYPADASASQDLQLAHTANSPAVAKPQAPAVGVLGAGAFASGVLLPAIKAVPGVRLVGVCAANGSHARQVADKFGSVSCTTDDSKIICDPAINTVVIATRHHLHAHQVLAAIAAGKHVFCEKPLCLTEEELGEIVAAQSAATGLLMVGFNRRFAPMTLRMKSFLAEINEPLSLHYRINAGYLPPDHWINDPDQGGGRIRGEVCHFLDLISFLAASMPVDVQVSALPNSGRYSDDNVILTLRLANGSQGTITYLANGDRSSSKERIEIFGGGSIAILEDFRRLELFRHGRKQSFRARLRQDKGHQAEWRAFAQAITNGAPSPIPFTEIVAGTLASFAALQSRATGLAVPILTEDFVRSHSRPSKP
jgi:predicted dehydrogenase